jgi:hypothetical protein
LERIVRLLFLDFDGVLHPVDSTARDLERFCWLHHLAQLLNGHDDVRIVVHSTWRYEYNDAELRMLLGPLGNRFVGGAPRGPREQVIEMVLQANRGVRHHLVLDDAEGEFCGARVNLLLLDSQRGLSDEQARQAIAHWLSSTATP